MTTSYSIVKRRVSAYAAFSSKSTLSSSRFTLHEDSWLASSLPFIIQFSSTTFAEMLELRSCGTERMFSINNTKIRNEIDVSIFIVRTAVVTVFLFGRRTCMVQRYGTNVPACQGLHVYTEREGLNQSKSSCEKKCTVNAE